jgi:hypothetical protein
MAGDAVEIDVNDIDALLEVGDCNPLAVGVVSLLVRSGRIDIVKRMHRIGIKGPAVLTLWKRVGEWKDIDKPKMQAFMETVDIATDEQLTEMSKLGLAE